MRYVTKQFKKALHDGRKDYLEYIDITLVSGKILNLTNENLWNGGLTIEDAVSSDSSFDVGSAIINKATVVINNIYDTFSEYDFESAEVKISIGFQLNENVEKIRMGVYRVDEANYANGIITLSCLDNMSLFDRAYKDSKLQYPATLGQIVRDACSVCGVLLNTPTFPNDGFIVAEKPLEESTTFREIISDVAQIIGCFCRCNADGKLELKWYQEDLLESDSINGGSFDAGKPYASGDKADGGSFNPWTKGHISDAGEFEKTNHLHHIHSTYSLNLSTDDVVITCVRVIEKNKTTTGEAVTTFEVGTPGYTICVENNQLIQPGTGKDVVNILGQKLIGFRFRKAEFTHTSDPTIEAGDVAWLIDSRQNRYGIIISSTIFSTGNSQSTKSSAQNPLRNSANRFSEATKNYVEYRKDLMQEHTDRELALKDMQNKLDNAPGTFTTIETSSNGSKIYYLHNKPKLAESNIVWKMTSEAWGVSTDGGKTYNGGMTVDGDTIVRILTATGISADWIKTGALKVVDENNNERFFVDTGTGVVRIKGDIITENERARIKLHNASMFLDYKSKRVGHIGSNSPDAYPTMAGLVFDLDEKGDYMAWACMDDPAFPYYIYKWVYAKNQFGSFTAGALNAGCDIDMHNHYLKNVNFDGGGITATMNYVQVTGVNTDGTLATWGKDGQMVFKNGILIGLKYY